MDLERMGFCFKGSSNSSFQNNVCGSFYMPPIMGSFQGTSSLDGVQQDEGDSFALDLSVDNAGDARNMSGLDDLSFNMDFEARDSNHNDGPMNLFGEASGGEGGGDDGGLGANFSFDL